MFFDKTCSKIEEDCPQFLSAQQAFEWLNSLKSLPEVDKIEKKFGILGYQFAALLAVNPVVNMDEDNINFAFLKVFYNEINHHAQLVCLTNSKDAVKVGMSLGNLLIDKYKGFTLDTSRVTDAKTFVSMRSDGTVNYSVKHPKWSEGFLPKNTPSSYFTH